MSLQEVDEPIVEERKTVKSVKSKITKEVIQEEPSVQPEQVIEETVIENQITVNGTNYKVLVVDEPLTWYESIDKSVTLNGELPTKEMLLDLLRTNRKWFSGGWYWSSTLSDREVWIQNYVDSKRTTKKKTELCKSIYLVQL
jgi:hypothetical protein